MIAVDRDALLCDLAETYRIYDFRALPVETLAAFSFGLRENSRIKRKLNGIEDVDELAIYAAIADNLTAIRCALRGQDPEKQFYFQAEMYVKKDKTESKPIYKFASSEEFKEIWNNG